ncbi:mandelate racemase/muconate lactonizing enzyme family protein [Alphaproteobacteria bacterium]|nr:mandelate racemase/muconate lactonizing enzyme family protein [Alphaproteobacteria bacterium]
MKIKSIKIYKIGLPLKEGSYKWSHGNEVKEFDNTIVKIESDTNHFGFGEVCTLGSAYLPAYAKGVRSGIREIGQSLIGQDPTNILLINNIMDQNLKGHPYVKSPIDMACWDLFGRLYNLPVWKLLGGKFGNSIDLYRAISQEEPKIMSEKVKGYKKEGYNKFQLKVGGDPNMDIARIIQVRSILDQSDILVADANTGWLMHDALKVVKATEHLDIYYEQPCMTYKECLTIRKKTKNPFILDENIDSVDSFLTAIKDGAMDIINIKISKLGGITKSKLLRDICVETHIPMTIEDSWGGDIATAAISHLAHSTLEKYRFSSTDFNSYNSITYTSGSPQKQNGKMQASDNPGLGVNIKEDVLGKPILKIT